MTSKPADPARIRWLNRMLGMLAQAGQLAAPQKTHSSRKVGPPRYRQGSGPGSIQEYDQQMTRYLHGQGKRPKR